MTNCLRPVAFDMRGLLDAVAEAEMTAYMAEKARRASHPDPLQDLRDGWDMHIAFSLAHPGGHDAARRRAPVRLFGRAAV